MCAPKWEDLEFGIGLERREVGASWEQAPPASTPPEAEASYRRQTRFLPS